MKSDFRAVADDQDDVRRLERVIPEIVRRVLEAGYVKITESPESVRRVMGDLKLPKEVLLAVLAHLDETRTGLSRIVSREVREFLEKTNVAEEVTRALTSMSLEIRTSVRFVPNAAGDPKPDVTSRVSVRKTRSSSPPPAHAGTPPPLAVAGDEPRVEPREEGK